MATKRKTPSQRATRSRKNVVGGVTRPEPDDGARGSVGVVATLVARQGGSVRLVFDDARAKRSGRWEPVGLFTSRDYPTGALRDLRLAPAELEKIGWLVIARLLALEETGRGR